MEELEKLYELSNKKRETLAKLKQDRASKSKIIKLENEIKILESSIQDLIEEIHKRQQAIREVERKIPSELKASKQYKSVVLEYIQHNSSPYIGDIRVTDDGKITFKYGGIPEIDDGKTVMQFKNGLIYIYEDKKEYDVDTRENLVHMEVRVEKYDIKGEKKERFTFIVNCNRKQCSYEENELFQWKKIEDISQLPIKELLSKHSVTSDLGLFLIENYTTIPKKKQFQETVNGDLPKEASITDKDFLTVEDLRKRYDYVFDHNAILCDKDDNFVRATEVEKDKERTIMHLFFKKKNGMVIPIPELQEVVEGDIGSNHYRLRSLIQYRQTRRGSHTFEIKDHKFDDRDNDENLGSRDRSNKTYPHKYYFYRYVTLDDIPKVVKVFEGEQEFENAKGSLYHRYKDKNGKQCIKLVDLEGNIHSIKENGKNGEKGLKEKTFGARGDCQLKVVYKNKEPVYALFIGNEEIENQEFCTAEELRNFFEKQKQNFKRFGWRMSGDSCFNQMEEVIENFNETFMQGNFIPLIDGVKIETEEKTLTELSEELSRLTKMEEQAKSLLEQYEGQIPDKIKGEI